MIVKAISCAETSLAVESNGLHLSASKLACKYVRSKPTGASNDGASVRFLAKFATNTQVDEVDDNLDALSNTAVADSGNYGSDQI